MKRGLFVIALILLNGFASAQQSPLVVHEWGTFTSLQDESGSTIAGINSDDEPVPNFCHDLNKLLVARPQELPPIMYQGAPRSHPDVTMRLETPVIYFHPPRDAALPITANIKVSFPHGWLTQFYPYAVSRGIDNFNRINPITSTSSLEWNDLKIGTAVSGLETTDHVWTAPRAVDAASVTTTNGESEKFLFYRGVANLPCPIQAKRSADGSQLELYCEMLRNFYSSSRSRLTPLSVPHLWLASFNTNGSCAFRSLPPVKLKPAAETELMLSTPSQFADAEYSTNNLIELRKQMRAALLEDGLFDDEAEALLNTWQLSYFKSGGLRLFFTVPREWTDHYLPLKISIPSEIKRAMIGRLELVTPEQRALLKQLAEAPVPTKPWAHYKVEGNKTIIEGTMPDAYRDLGRFRNALLLDEFAQRPTPSLEAFIRLNGLQGHRQ